MNIAVDIIKNNISEVISIHISGSFGKGEGAIIPYKNKLFINDYDFVVVLKDRQKSERNKTAQILRDKLGIYVSIACLYPDLSNLDYNRQNDIDILYNSKCLYGKDILNIRRPKIIKIKKVDSIKLLYSRMRTIVDCFHKHNGRIYVPETLDSRIGFIYNLIKGIMHTIDAHLIYFECYHPKDSIKQKKEKLSKCHVSILNEIDQLCFKIESVDYLTISESPNLNLFAKQVCIILINSLNIIEKNIGHKYSIFDERLGLNIRKALNVIFNPIYYLNQLKIRNSDLINYKTLKLFVE